MQSITLVLVAIGSRYEYFLVDAYSTSRFSVGPTLVKRKTRLSARFLHHNDRSNQLQRHMSRDISPSSELPKVKDEPEFLWESEEKIEEEDEIDVADIDDASQDIDLDLILEPSYLDTATFLARSVASGVLTGISVVFFKKSIAVTSELLFESLANILPKPAFYWPLALYPLLGSLIVSLIAYSMGGMNRLKGGVDAIAKSVVTNGDIAGPPWQVSFMRSASAVATLGSGNSLGPEGPSVEIGASISQYVSALGKTTNMTMDNRGMKSCSPRQYRDLFLAGCAAGVSAGFHAPIAGILFALEVGSRFLARNSMDVRRNPGDPIVPTMPLDESAPDGPRSDIAAVVLASSLATIMTDVIGGSELQVRIQGNIYAMVSPWLEFPAYLLLGLVCGAVAMIFTKLRDFFVQLFEGEEEWSKRLPFKDIPLNLRPMFGGLICGLVAIYFPQTLFNSYVTLDGLMSGYSPLSVDVALTLLGLKILLSAWCVGCGLIGGVFAPSLFFGATAGVAFHDLLSTSVIEPISKSLEQVGSSVFHTEGLGSFLELAKTPAYSTVGAAATLGALFRAPLTASMLIFELTQNHDLVLPVLAATGVGGLFAELISRPRRLW